LVDVVDGGADVELESSQAHQPAGGASAAAILGGLGVGFAVVPEAAATDFASGWTFDSTSTRAARQAVHLIAGDDPSSYLLISTRA